MLRMRRASIFGLCDILEVKGLLFNTLHVSVEEHMAMFLHVVGYNMRNRIVGVNFYDMGNSLADISTLCCMLLENFVAS